MDGITAIDRQEGTEQGWHRKTVVKPSISIDDNFLTEWDIVPVKLDNNGKPTPFQTLVCTDLPDHYIGTPFVVKNGKVDVEASTGEKKGTRGYKPINNQMFLKVVGDALKDIKNATIVSLGSVMGRGRIFVSIKIPELPTLKVNHREFEQFLNFGSSHDRSCAFYVNTSNICTVCFNTFTMNLHHKGKLVNARVRHDGDVVSKLENVSQLIDASIGTGLQFKEIFAKLDDTKIKEEAVSELFTGFMCTTEELSTYTANRVNRLVELFKTGKGNRGETLGDVFSAITDFYTHESTRGRGSNQQYQFEVSEFGAGVNRKQEFFDLLQNKEEMKKVSAIGRNLLTAAPKETRELILN